VPPVSEYHTVITVSDVHICRMVKEHGGERGETVGPLLDTEMVHN